MNNTEKECSSCGATCPFGDEEDPCEGQVNVIDEIDLGGDCGWAWIHACVKHEDKY